MRTRILCASAAAAAPQNARKSKGVARGCAMGDKRSENGGSRALSRGCFGVNMFKRPFLVVLAIALAACSEGGPPAAPGAALRPLTGWSVAPSRDLNAFFECLERQGAAMVSAHRGGPAAGYPENALETMEALLADIPAMMEVDVAASADGVLYLMHDETLDRATNGAGAVDALSWPEIRKLTLEDDAGEATPFAPARLRDALAWAKGRTILQIDIKRSARFEDVADEITRQEAGHRVVIIAYSKAAAQKLRRLLPETMISLSLGSQSELNGAVAGGLSADRLIAFAGTGEPKPRLFSVLNGQGVEVVFGALGAGGSLDAEIARTGDEKRYAELAAMGVDIIATDRPRAAHAALAAAGRAAAEGVCGVRRRGTRS